MIFPKEICNWQHSTLEPYISGKTTNLEVQNVPFITSANAVHKQMTWQYHKQQGISQNSSLVECHILLPQEYYTPHLHWKYHVWQAHCLQRHISYSWHPSEHLAIMEAIMLVKFGGRYTSIMVHRNYILRTCAVQSYGNKIFLSWSSIRASITLKYSVKMVVVIESPLFV
jgi:hypothetical protein